MSSQTHVTVATSALTVWSDPAVPAALRDDFAAQPLRWIQAASGRPVKISRESLVIQAAWPQGDRMTQVAVKQFRPRSFWKACTAAFRPAKAMHNWRMANFLLAHNIATPQPLLACRPRRTTAAGTSLLVTRWVAGAENLHHYCWRLAALPARQRQTHAASCAEVLGRLLGRMHAAGAAHRDLKAANLLVAEEDGRQKIYLIDLAGLSVGRQIGIEQQTSNLARLAVSMAAHPWISRSICRRFLLAYLAELPAAKINWKPLWRATARDAAARIRRKQRRGERVL